MRLEPGHRLGSYEIVAPLGRGGMGEVYRARDSRLHREVAIKVLPRAFENDPERLARFEREAQLLATLNHPNIAAIYGVEEADGVGALVLELVEGPTLSHRLVSGALPPDEALAIAAQIADALDAAHERGVIHRDLKPANVKLTPEGAVKVLDFGLAKAFDPFASAGGAADSPTLTAMDTQPGVLLGTAAYMSPEQARGRSVDKRTDVWAFGCVLFEMLTGRRPFDGDSVTETLAELMKSEPDWQALPASTPATVRVLLRRCLEKDPRRRLRDMGDARLLMDPGFGDATASGVGPSSPAVPSEEEVAVARARARRRSVLGLGAGVVLLAAGLALGALVARGSGADQAPAHARFVLNTPPNYPILDFDLADSKHLAISPDGSRVVYVMVMPRHLILRAADDLEGRLLSGTEDARVPFFSPDGLWIGFTQRLELRKVSTRGGSIETVCKLPETGFPRGASWNQQGTIVFSQGSGLYRVSAAGGAPEKLTSPDLSKGEGSHNWPHFLPDGESLLFEIRDGTTSGPGQIAVLEHESGKWRPLELRGSSPSYLSSGQLVFAFHDTLRAVPFDARRLEVEGDPASVLDEVMTFALSGAADFATSLDGSLVYSKGDASKSVADTMMGVPVLVDRDGREETLPGLPPDTYQSVRMSPDGKTLALDMGKGDIWTYDLGRGTLMGLTTDPAYDTQPVWTPDGRRIVFASNRGGAISLYWQSADGSGQAERLATFAPPIDRVMPEGFTPDGKKLLLSQLVDAQIDTAVLSMDGEREVRPLLDTESFEGGAAVSPDGRWIAYQSNRMGDNSWQVFVERFPELGDRQRVSVDPAILAQWSPDGRELYFLGAQGAGGRRLFAVPTEIEPRFEAGAPRVLLEGSYRPGWGSARPYAVAPDGRHFVIIRADESVQKTSVEPVIVLVQRWGDEVVRKLASG